MRKNTAESFWARVDRTAGPDGCWPWMGQLNRGGYGRISWRGVHGSTHRLAWELAVGAAWDQQILHHCDNRTCCNPKHLWAGTHQDNMKDRHQKGRSKGPTGASAPKAKLDRARVDDLRRLNATYRPRRYDLAWWCGISASAVGMIVYNRVWK